MTVAEMLDALGRRAEQAWYETRTGYYDTKRKISDMIYGAKNAAESAADAVRESQQGYDWMSENAPKAAEKVAEMTRKLKQPPPKRKSKPPG